MHVNRHAKQTREQHNRANTKVLHNFLPTENSPAIAAGLLCLDLVCSEMLRGT